MNRRVLFLVNGLGLGNSTRCFAIIQRLLATGAEIEVLTSNNGLWFFSDKSGIARIGELSAIPYAAKEGRLSAIGTLTQLRRMRTALAESNRTVAEAISRFRPHVIVSDSVYDLGAIRHSGVPHAAINNSDMILRKLLKLKQCPGSVLPQLLLIETPDYLYHRSIPDLVISPRLDPRDTDSDGSFRAVGPVVREDCLRIPETGTRPARIVVLLSGSAFGIQVTLRRTQAPNGDPLQIDVIGRTPPRPETPGERTGPGQTVYHGKRRDSLELLRRADLLVVNAGCSAISEGLILGKPMVILPIPNHAEQWVNARIAEELGVAMKAAEPDLDKAFDEALQRIDDFRAAYSRLRQFEDGAASAAEHILGLAR